MVRFRLQEEDCERLWELRRQRRIWTTERNSLRISAHIHTRSEDLELFFQTPAQAVG